MEEPMDLAATDRLLCTTRSVRKRLDLDRAVEPELIDRCIEISLQAPTGSNTQGWRVMVVTDPTKRRVIADAYRDGFKIYQELGLAPTYEAGDLRSKQREKILSSSTYLVENLHRVPVHVIYSVEGRVEEMGQVAQASIYGSVLPAAWSFMLAARARGLGSAWTTIHLFHEKQVAEALGIPESITQAVLLPVAYYKGDDFKPAKRLPARELTYWNTWGSQRR
jgi:nitroreductase